MDHDEPYESYAHRAGLRLAAVWAASRGCTVAAIHTTHMNCVLRPLVTPLLSAVYRVCARQTKQTDYQYVGMAISRGVRAA